MRLKPFLLDDWLDQYEHDIEFDLGASTGPRWTVNDVLALADDETRRRFLNHDLVYSRVAGADGLLACTSVHVPPWFTNATPRVLAITQSPFETATVLPETVAAVTLPAGQCSTAASSCSGRDPAESRPRAAAGAREFQSSMQPARLAAADLPDGTVWVVDEWLLDPPQPAAAIAAASTAAAVFGRLVTVADPTRWLVRLRRFDRTAGAAARPR